MPNIKSQIKRVKTNAKENEINKAKKSAVKTALKKFNAAIAEKDLAKAESLFTSTVSIIDSARLDGIYHRNNASRKIANVNKALDSIKESK